MEKTPKNKKRQKKEQGSLDARNFALFFFAALLCYTVCFFLAVIVSHALYLPRSGDFYLSVFALCVAAFLTSFFAASKLRRNGLAVGLLSCLPFHLLFLLVSLFSCGWDADWTVVISFAILSLTSMLGGVIAVNRRQKANPTTVHRRKGRKT